jgi:SAM-dependent methyltransferase
MTAADPTHRQANQSAEAAEAFQIPLAAAETYETVFVPAFFAQWAQALCQAAAVAAGDQVLDVACGTGVVARAAAGIVGTGNVVGVDLNQAMLTIAQRAAPQITWRQGEANALPAADASFDVVVCQMALMFFPDQPGAVREMARVTKPGGRVAVVVPSALDAQDAYGPFVAMAADHAGPGARNLLSTYFSCGQPEHLQGLFTAAGLDVTLTRPHRGTARFPSVDALVETEVTSTPLRERITDQTYTQIRDGARRVLAPFTAPDGHLEAPFESQIVVGHHR